MDAADAGPRGRARRPRRSGHDPRGHQDRHRVPRACEGGAGRRPRPGFRHLRPGASHDRGVSPAGQEHRRAEGAHRVDARRGCWQTRAFPVPVRGQGLLDQGIGARCYREPAGGTGREGRCPRDPSAAREPARPGHPDLQRRRRQGGADLAGGAQPAETPRGGGARQPDHGARGSLPLREGVHRARARGRPRRGRHQEPLRDRGGPRHGPRDCPGPLSRRRPLRAHPAAEPAPRALEPALPRHPSRRQRHPRQRQGRVVRGGPARGQAKVLGAAGRPSRSRHRGGQVHSRASLPRACPASRCRAGPAGRTRRDGHDRGLDLPRAVAGEAHGRHPFPRRPRGGHHRPRAREPAPRRRRGAAGGDLAAPRERHPAHTQLPVLRGRGSGAELPPAARGSSTGSSPAGRRAARAATPR